jgi:predicted nucleic acid-binding protein
MELLEGIREDDFSARARFDMFLSDTDVHPVVESTATVAATIRRNLRQRKVQFDYRALDILIAATAIDHDLILVIGNTRHFRDIGDLRLWPAD